MKKYIILIFSWFCAIPLMAQMEIRGEAIVETARQFIGCPYQWGATGPKEFDCSGLVQYCFKHNRIIIPRTSGEQSRQGQLIEGGWNHLATGDLVFFGVGKVSHVGIYVQTEGAKAHKFIHASGHGVMISKLEESYWSTRYRFARRLTLNTVVAIEPTESTSSSKGTQSSKSKDKDKQDKSVSSSGTPSVTKLGDAPDIASVELCNSAAPRTKNWKTRVKKNARKYIVMAN